MINEGVTLIKLFGVWGIVAVAVLIIGLLVYNQYKSNKKKEEEHNCQNLINNNLKYIVTVLKTIIDNQGGLSVALDKKIDKIEGKLTVIENEFQKFDSHQIQSNTEQKMIINNVDRIVSKIMEVVIELKAVVVNVRKKSDQ